MSRQADLVSFVDLVQSLALAKSNGALIEALKRGARQIIGSDGVTVVFKDGDKCFYIAEDAMAPLFAPNRFPQDICISGWVMQNASSVVIPDIYVDSRIPIEVYRPTFVKSLGMVPIRSKDPIGALGFYWAREYTMNAEELRLAQALGDAASTALENIAHQENLEQRVRERTEQLSLTLSDLQLFAGNVAHDLRSPLSVIQANAQLLLRAQLADQDDRESLGDILHASRHMSSMLQGLLELSKVTSAPLQRQRIDLSAIAQDVARTLRGAHTDRQVALEIEPELKAEADPALMRIVLNNLMDNAWKYTSKRPQALIRFGRADTTQGPAFMVQDNGAGFDSEASPPFAAFTRFHTANEFPGTGLGLTTVHRAIRRLAGKVWVESRRDDGARFYFQLPEPSAGPLS